MCKLEKIPHLLIYFFIGPSLKGTRTDAGLGKYFIDDKILVNCNNSKPSVKMVATSRSNLIYNITFDIDIVFLYSHIYSTNHPPVRCSMLTILSLG